MKIYLAADHNGFELKRHLAKFLVEKGYEVEDDGDKKIDPKDDFPVFASKAVLAMKGSDDPDPRAILICGSGQGMAMAANRYRGVRASLVWNISEAKSSRNDDNANVLCLSAAQTSKKDAEPIVRTWLETAFAAAPRFVRRLKELDDLEHAT
jgi:ribose 5-phosphate isomerase B